MEKIIEVSGFKKSYGDVKAVDGIDFYAEQGKLFAFLGPNGAGKSTTIDILCTLLEADSGTAEIDGHTVGKEDAEIRSAIGVVFQDNMLDALLTVKENLLTRGSFYRASKKELVRSVEKAMKVTGISELAGRRYGKLSGGQKRRADIARALVHTPKILFLDEPTTGLDPQTRKNIWDTVRGLQLETGMTVFLTTHYMEEAAEADYVIVIDGGKIAAKGTPAELKARYSSDRLVMRSDNPKGLEEVLTRSGFSFKRENGTVTAALENTLQAIPILESCGEFVNHIEVLSGSMDDVFIGITGKEIRE
ncbi:MAG TPA: ABC transporter [Ruminococcaceae bacterium]|nr:ABC transporter [Oscillospiraceae bacterium]